MAVVQGELLLSLSNPVPMLGMSIAQAISLTCV